MILRLSGKLAAKVKAGRLPGLPIDENPLADWSAHLFVCERTQYILLSNTKSLYSTIMMGKGIANEQALVQGIAMAICDCLQRDGYDEAFRRFIAPHLASVQLAKALDRQVVGSMNDLINQSKWSLPSHTNPTITIGDELNGTPMSMLSTKGHAKYGYPRQCFQELVESMTENGF